jgi:hypothetical protein
MTVYIDREYGNAVSLSISGTGNRGRSHRRYQILIEEDRGFYYPVKLLKNTVNQ